MIAIFIAPVIVALLIFEFIREIKFFNKYPVYKKTKITILVLLAIVFPLTIPVSFLLPTGIFKTILTRFANYYSGIAIYLIIGLLLGDIIRFVYKIISRDKYSERWAIELTNVFAILFATIMSFYGIINAHNLHTTYYDINSSKTSSVNNLNVVLIADIHLGYNVGEKEIKNMVNKINASNPDVVVLAGDIFDNDFNAIQNPERIEELLRSIKAKYGKFAIYGNHDVDEKVFCGFSLHPKEKLAEASDDMNNFMANSSFTFLYDKGVSIRDENGNIITNIYGRPDAHRINFGNSERVAAKDITGGFSEDNYFICVDHEPKDLQELADAGVDLDLSGHTHNGQVWPGTISIKFAWDNAYGLLQVDDMTSIVTSGVGLFGINMRTGCIAEIAQINISFNK